MYYDCKTCPIWSSQILYTCTKCGCEFCSGCLEKPLKYDPFCPTCKPAGSSTSTLPYCREAASKWTNDSQRYALLHTTYNICCVTVEWLCTWYCTIHLCRSCTDSHCLAIKDTTPYNLTTTYQGPEQPNSDWGFSGMHLQNCLPSWQLYEGREVLQVWVLHGMVMVPWHWVLTFPLPCHSYSYWRKPLMPI